MNDISLKSIINIGLGYGLYEVPFQQFRKNVCSEAQVNKTLKVAVAVLIVLYLILPLTAIYDF